MLGRNFGILIILIEILSACNFVEFFQEEDSDATSESTGVTNVPVIGDSLGPKASNFDANILESVYSETSDIPPASIRPDPDMYSRRLLLQYRQEGATVAREIGSIEGFRLLLGGASEDFQKNPQKDFDATSLLASLIVAEKICEGLVAPNDSQHIGWSSILPQDPSNWEENIKFLAQRFIGKRSENIDTSVLDSLKSIMDAYESSTSYSNSSYIPVCTTLAMDADSLLL